MKRRGDDQKFLAKVLAIGTECDIALLTVEVSEPCVQLNVLICDCTAECADMLPH